MDRVLVVNASPLIFLARIERLDLLASLAKLLVVPEAVIREIQAGSNRDGAADRVHDLVSGSEVVLDDLAARRCARSLDLPMIGTLGVVLLCRHRGVISAARPIIQALCNAGLRLKPALVDEALAKVNE